MSAVPQVPGRMTEDEYLAFERASEFRHEYIDGEVYEMEGANIKHSSVKVSTLATLYQQLRKTPSTIYATQMRVRTPTTRSYVYPDIIVVSGKAQSEGELDDNLLNPTLIIEVLSPSTERYDRGRKFQLYRELESLQEYLLIAQDQPRIEHFSRQDANQWLLTAAVGLEATLELPSIGCTLALAEVYEQVTFSTEEDGA